VRAATDVPIARPPNHQATRTSCPSAPGSATSRRPRRKATGIYPSQSGRPSRSGCRTGRPPTHALTPCSGARHALQSGGAQDADRVPDGDRPQGDRRVRRYRGSHATRTARTADLAAATRMSRRSSPRWSPALPMCWWSRAFLRGTDRGTLDPVCSEARARALPRSCRGRDPVSHSRQLRGTRSWRGELVRIVDGSR
jgi:hypothetical protein